MSYDEGLTERLHDHFKGRNDVEEKKMFGGFCFMVSNHMCCGIVKDILMLRVGPDNYEKCLTKNHASEMNFTGKAMKGMVYIALRALILMRNSPSGSISVRNLLSHCHLKNLNEPWYIS